MGGLVWCDIWGGGPATSLLTSSALPGIGQKRSELAGDETSADP